MAPMVVGCDIGFGNLKLVYGRTIEQAVRRVLPSGAVPIAQAPRAVDSSQNPMRGHTVNVAEPGGEDLWKAGVSWSDLPDVSRVLHSDYPSTKEYWALYMAALLEARTDHIDLLVTGLPFSQFNQNADAVTALQSKMVGVHHPSSERTVTVKAVKVMQQAIGAYVDAAYTDADVHRLRDAHTLVFDAGFYSVDYVLLYRTAIFDGQSSSSMSATSEILDEAAKKMARHYAARVSREAIEDALRKGEKRVMVINRLESFEPFVEAAARTSATKVINQIRNGLRSAAFDVGCVILAGGAGSLYEPVLREAFPKAHIYNSPQPVLANARGFFRAGLRQSTMQQDSR
jgi:plasmid segregation protein ParM